MQQKQVLDFVQRLALSGSEPVQHIMQHARQLDFPREDLGQMRQFIEEEFERIDWDDRNNPPAFPNGQ